jgi:hypothetical protein
MIIDHIYEKWQPIPMPVWTPALPAQPVPMPAYPPAQPYVAPKLPTHEEVDDFRRLYERAKEYDRRTGQPDCELEQKRKLIKELAERLGVDVSFADRKFWGHNIRDYSGRLKPDQTDPEWRQCGAIKHDARGHCYGVADLEIYGTDAVSELVNMPLRRELAVVQDGSGCHAALRSRADFGCVLFERKGGPS